MGFDIHGMNPIVRKGKKPEIPEGLYEGKKIDEKIVDEYYEKKWKFEEENVGAYFRNNVWWWRGLWDYVYEVCEPYQSVIFPVIETVINATAININTNVTNHQVLNLFEYQKCLKPPIWCFVDSLFKSNLLLDALVAANAVGIASSAKIIPITNNDIANESIFILYIPDILKTPWRSFFL